MLTTSGGSINIYRGHIGVPRILQWNGVHVVGGRASRSGDGSPPLGPRSKAPVWVWGTKCEISVQFFKRFPVENLGFNEYRLQMQSLDSIFCKHNSKKILQIQSGVWTPNPSLGTPVARRHLSHMHIYVFYTAKGNLMKKNSEANGGSGPTPHHLNSPLLSTLRTLTISEHPELANSTVQPEKSKIIISGIYTKTLLTTEKKLQTSWLQLSKISVQKYAQKTIRASCMNVAGK